MLPAGHGDGPPTHLPSWQVSLVVQKSPSSQALASAAASWTQRPPMHTPTRHVASSEAHSAAVVQGPVLPVDEVGDAPPVPAGDPPVPVVVVVVLPVPVLV